LTVGAVLEGIRTNIFLRLCISTCYSEPEEHTAIKWAIELFIIILMKMKRFTVSELVTVRQPDKEKIPNTTGKYSWMK
jgi:hypothetical protein